MNRRQFLSATAASMAAGALIPKSFAQTTPDKVSGLGVSGMNYAPTAAAVQVVKPGEFQMAAVRLDHGHILGTCNGLTEAGATLKWVWDSDPSKVANFRAKFPQAQVASSLEQVLNDPDIKLVAAAAITSERGPLGCQVMEAGKDYFSDKAPFTTMDQLNQSKAVVAKTGRKHYVYFSERLHNEAGMYATDMMQQGLIGKVIQVVSLAPHRLAKETRPAWFFKRAQYGGVLCDIGSHQFEQFLTYTNATDATISHAAIGNFGNADYPEFEDFGEANLVGNTGSLNYVRVDWFTPDGLSTWGDGRTFILGTKGYIELRKYVDIARDDTSDHVYMTDEKGEHRFDVKGKVGYRFFGEFIVDCLNRTEKSMTQAHVYKAAELSLLAQAKAQRLTT
jgi:predicted dehydrogenase